MFRHVWWTPLFSWKSKQFLDTWSFHISVGSPPNLTKWTPCAFLLRCALWLLERCDCFKYATFIGEFMSTKCQIMKKNKKVFRVKSPCSKLLFTKIPKNPSWLVVGPALWKIWIRQLGWLFFNISGKIKLMATKPPTSQMFHSDLIRFTAISMFLKRASRVFWQLAATRCWLRRSADSWRQTSHRQRCRDCRWVRLNLGWLEGVDGERDGGFKVSPSNINFFEYGWDIWKIEYGWNMDGIWDLMGEIGPPPDPFLDGISPEINHPAIGVPPWRAGNPQKKWGDGGVQRWNMGFHVKTHGDIMGVPRYPSHGHLPDLDDVWNGTPPREMDGNGMETTPGWWARATPLKNMSPSIGMIRNPIFLGK